ncbi:hypothetical protein ACWCPY_42785, partial [Streptomyces sp. NPDC002403]
MQQTLPPLSVTAAQRVVLEGWVRRRTTAQALDQRSRIVLECAEGRSILEVSRSSTRSPWGAFHHVGGTVPLLLIARVLNLA